MCDKPPVRSVGLCLTFRRHKERACCKSVFLLRTFWMRTELFASIKRGNYSTSWARISFPKSLLRGIPITKLYKNVVDWPVIPFLPYSENLKVTFFLDLVCGSVSRYLMRTVFSANIIPGSGIHVCFRIKYKTLRFSLLHNWNLKISYSILCVFFK